MKETQKKEMKQIKEANSIIEEYNKIKKNSDRILYLQNEMAAQGRHDGWVLEGLKAELDKLLNDNSETK